jgi:short subunit dehydrogenase-like uncharacterized protein
MNKTFLLYGAYGYTGELILQYAAKQRLRPIIAGRSLDKLEPLAKKYDLPFRVFSLDETEKLDAALKETEFVLHCAGPFSLTSKLMVEACLRTRRHYTDITGEIAVFESMARRDAKAKEAGIMIMPGVGFDVVPSDCLALHLKNHLPAATNLTLAFYGMGRISHGTQATMTMNVGQGGAVRRDGQIVRVPAAYKTRDIDFGEFKKTGVTIPWGDVATAYYSTGIPNIEVYTILPPSNLKMLKMSRYLGWLLASGPVQKYLQKQIPAGGPNEEERAKGRTFLWGEASDNDGNRIEARQQGPEGYTLTALAALNVAAKILNGNFQPGFRTPAKAYGADLILEIDGVTREA